MALNSPVTEHDLFRFKLELKREITGGVGVVLADLLELVAELKERVAKLEEAAWRTGPGISSK